MNIKTSEKFKSQTTGFFNSYTQVFFSDNRLFAVILLLVSFLDMYAGICGALSVVISNLLARGMGFNEWLIGKGYYGYNSLLVGLGFGLTFEPGMAFFLLVPVMALLTFLFTVAIQGFLFKYGLPYLSLPFLLGFWLIMLASGQFSALGLSARGIYTFNELYSIGGIWLIDTVEWFDKLITSEGLRTYLFSLGAVFFQQNLLAGVLIALGILIYSRIAFTLSLLGFLLAWLFYGITGSDLSSLGYTYIGFNYILTSIALGGFFIIPSRWSYFWLIWLLPLVIVVTISLQKIFAVFQLGVYALPFNIVVLIFLYVLKIREKPGEKLVETSVQHFSPEKNLYHNLITQFRFLPEYLPVDLPVIGEWTVNQGYYGEFTHKGDWAHGIDLVITGKDGSQFRNSGFSLSDYYCYEKPVSAVADGSVADLIDGIPDNLPGENNIRQNWGNSIVIRHHENLYSQVSHLKPGSFRVKKGDPVKKGEIIGLCGNSGRSPYPHLHFQMQTTPHIGSKTLRYPFSGYLVAGQGNLSLHSHAIPLQGETLQSLRNHPLFEKALQFFPGAKLVFQVTGSKRLWLDKTHLWEIKTDEYNNSYFECSDSGARAYFYNNGHFHYFTNFIGSRRNLLYYFYLGFYGLPAGFYPELKIQDALPPDKTSGGIPLVIQDFLAPFHLFLKPEYELEFVSLAEDFYAAQAGLEVKIREFGKEKASFDIRLAENRISEFRFHSKTLTFTAICTGSY
ncbi:MAG TPA: urea transporter [Prolixibacteraceae bacterium]|nr:urea transporter [Prolixibacteraceae bacterium]